MASRPAILATLLGASIGVPYVVSHSNGDADKGGMTPATTRPFSQQFQSGQRPLPGQPAYGHPAAIDRTPFYPLAEVLRMDISKEWVYARWPRKTTGLSDPERFGIRVPLVTGTSPSDLAGSLTYYFDAQGQVQHISIRGRTGDTSPLVRLLATQYGFQRMAGERPGEQLYQVKRNGKVQSELRAQPASVVRSYAPHESFLVELELERPDSRRTIERPLPKLVIPTSPGGSTVAEVQAEPPKPVAVGPVSVFQRFNNQLVGHGDAPLEGAATSPASSTDSQPATKSKTVTPVEIPRPAVRWPG